MQGRANCTFFVKAALIFAFVFFFVIEWRWQALLLGAPDIKPHILASVLSLVVIVTGGLSLRGKRLRFWIVLLLIFYLMCVAILNTKELIGADGYGLVRELGVLAISLAIFITAGSNSFWKYIYDNPKKILTLCALFALSLFLLRYILASDMTNPSFDLRQVVRLSGLSETSEYGVSYQSVGDKLVVLAFIVLSLNITQKLKVAAVVVCLAALYLVGSKASMVGYIFACCAYYVISLFFTKRYVKLCMISLLFCFALIAGFAVVVGSSSLQNSDNWLIATVARGKEDRSVSSRREIEEENQKTRTSRIILGDYKFDYKRGRPGSYTHSALGIIDYYGPPIFVVSVGIWLYLLFRLTMLMKRRAPIVTAALMTMLYYTLLFSIARFPPANYLTFWALGLAVFAVSRETGGIPSPPLDAESRG